MSAGRPKNIESPEQMEQYFNEYEVWAKTHPILVQDFVGKDGDEVNRKRERPLTMEGFEVWLWKQKIASDISQYVANREGRYAEFVPICRTIKQRIRNDQIEGGMAGIYNPSITQRLNGLTEKTENENRNENTEIVKFTMKLKDNE